MPHEWIHSTLVLALLGIVFSMEALVSYGRKLISATSLLDEADVIQFELSCSQ